MDYQIFISYAGEDFDKVQPIYNSLCSKGLSVWLDKTRLDGGDNWNHEILSELNKSKFVILIITQKSIVKRGYVQKELNIAMDNLENYLDEDVYIIPVVFDNVSPPVKVNKRLQHINFDSVEAVTEKLFKSIQKQIKKYENELENSLFLAEKFSETKIGYPGYSISLDLVKTQQSGYFKDIQSIVNGLHLNTIFEAKKVLYEDQSDVCDFLSQYSDDDRRNELSVDLDRVSFKGKVLSFCFTAYIFNLGAAHGNFHFETYVFSIDDGVRLINLREFFQDEDAAFGEIQRYIRRKLINRLKTITSDDESDLDDDSLQWVSDGTESWDELSNFIFEENSLKVLFPPYSVAAYAYGSHEIDVPYELIEEFFKPNFKEKLSLFNLKQNVVQ